MSDDTVRLEADEADEVDEAIAWFRRGERDRRSTEAAFVALAYVTAIDERDLGDVTPEGVRAAIFRRITSDPDERSRLFDEIGAQLLREIRRALEARRRKLQGATVARSPRAHREADPIELFTGELVHEETDLVVRGAGIDFAFRRTHRSRADFTGALGARWDHAYHVTLALDDAIARIWHGDLRADVYRRHPRWGEPGFTYYVPPDGVDATLEPIGGPDAPGGWQRRAPDGTRHIFEPTAWGPGLLRLARIEDRFGNALRFDYEDERLVRCQVNHPARWVRFVHDAQGRLTAISDHTGRTWRYVHDDVGDLAAVIAPPTPEAPSGAITRFEYADHRLIRVLDADGGMYLENDFDDAGRVRRQRLSGGESYFTYERVAAAIPGDLDVAERPTVAVRVLERHGRETVHVYNETGALLRRSECRLLRDGRAGHEHVVWRYRYSRDGICVASRSPEGVVTQAVTGRDRFVRARGVPDDDDLWRHDDLTAEQRRGFARVVTTLHRATVHNALAGVGWSARFGDPWHPQPDDTLVRLTYEPAFGQPLTVSDPRFPDGPAHERHLTRYEYASGPGRRLLRVVHPTPTMPDGTAGAPVVETIDEVDPRGRILRRTDPTGIVTALDYHDDAAGPRAGFLRRIVVDPEGLALTTELDVDELGRTITVTPPRGVATGDPRFATRTRHDALDRLVAVERPGAGGSVRTRHTLSGQVARVERDWLGPDGAPAADGPLVEVLSWNQEHLLVARATGGTDQLGHRITRHRYGPAGELVATTLPRGNRIETRHDERLLPVATTHGAGTPDAATSAASYDADGRLVATTSAEGHVTRLELDAAGRAVQRTDPLGHVVRIDHDRAGNVVLERWFERSADGYRLLARRAHDHDELGRVIRIHDDVFEGPIPVPPGAPLATAFRDAGPGRWVTRAIVHDAAGRVVATIDELGRRTSTEYDRAGRLVAVTDPAGNRTALTLDEHGNVVRRDRFDLVRDLDGDVVATEVLTATATYDELDRIVTETDGMGNTTTHAYDSLDRPVRTVDPLGNVVEQVYDVHGDRVAVVERRDPDPPAIARTEHDANGNAVAVIDALGRRTELHHDALDRPIQRTYPDGSADRVWYDRDGNAIRRREPHGVVIRTLVDPLGRPTWIEADLAEVDADVIIEGPRSIERELDGLGRVVRASNEVATITHDFDSRGLPISDQVTISGAPHRLARRFDDAGGLAGLTTPSGRQLDHHRDALGRLRTLVEPGASPTTLARFAHAGARLRTVERGNGTRSQTAHDAAGRLLVIEHVGHLVIQQLPDAAGDPRLRVEARRGEHYGYDRGHRLAFAAHEAERDPVDVSPYRPPSAPPTSPTSLQSALDAARGTPPPAASTWAYDLADNRVKVERPGAPPQMYAANDLDQYAAIDGVERTYDRAGNLRSDGVRDYRYDAFGRLVRVLDATTGAELARYQHDPLGRRISEIRDGRAIVSLFDGPDRIADLVGDVIVAEYTHGDAIDAPVHVRAAGVDAWYHLDAQGSVRLLTGAAGGVLGRYRYDPFGELVEEEGAPLGPIATATTFAQPFGYTARPRDPITGHYDLRARTYDPATGRFLQRDPLGPVDGPNLYAYAGSSPLRFVDPLGLARRELARGGSIEAEPLHSEPQMTEAEVKDHIRRDIQRRMLERARTKVHVGSGRSLLDGVGGTIADIAEGAGEVGGEIVAGAGEFVKDTAKAQLERVTSGRIFFTPWDLAHQGIEFWGGLHDTGSAIADDPKAFAKSFTKPKTWGYLLPGLIAGRKTPAVPRSIRAPRRSRWFSFWRDKGGETRPHAYGAPYTGRLAWANRLGLRQGYSTTVQNLDVNGSWFARTDTAAHEGFHALVARHTPSVWRLGEMKLLGQAIGAPVKYAEEVVAYAIGHAASLRFHAIPLAPLEAFGSLSLKEGLTVGVYATGGVVAYTRFDE